MQEFNPEEIDENQPIDVRIDYVQSFQALSNSYEALVTYDEYNDEMEKNHQLLAEQVHLIEEQIGTYETIKGSLVKSRTWAG